MPTASTNARASRLRSLVGRAVRVDRVRRLPGTRRMAAAHPGSGPVEPVTGATYGSNEAGVGRVHLDLGSKSLYGDVDEARIAQVVVTPDPLEQHLAGEHLARPARQLEQEPELRGREREV